MRHNLLPSLLAMGLGLTGSAALAQQTGPDSLREVFRDWSVNCETLPEGPRLCEMVQQVNQQESGQRVLAFSVRLSDGGQPVAVLITPFGLKLSEGLGIAVEDTIVVRGEYETCLSEGCLSLIPLSEDIITAMQRGTNGAVVMVSRNNEQVSVPLSMLGFTNGLDRLRALSEN
ncbi:invasion associated locus B family protein [Roseibaca sp. V10]|uniref:Invasion associated locus B family protein n=1 Tax=Roseinatronobacter domitianus TaxID=2940293 RepID=A0ABT0M2T6_9RHOB|nr:invasion associated locus B family protein [Roseibaca domitiana]MCL1629167.1 invasion associated locus B family protein [Roseibaca domitiana]